MMNRNNQMAYNIGNNQNKRIIMPQNKQVKMMPKTTNNSQKKPMMSGFNYNNRNISNNNSNNNIVQNNALTTNSNDANDELGKAILIIRRELRRKDNRIIELEKKVIELTNKLNSLLNKNNNNMSSNTTPYKRWAKDDLKEDDEKMKMGEVGGAAGYSGGGMNNIINIRKNHNRNNNYLRSISQNTNNYNSDNENMAKRLPYDNLSHSNDNSVLTYNGVQTNSKKEVKNYLKEVKSKIEAKKFKQFIRNIKLLTAKNNSALNKDIIIESVKMLFGEEHKDLFIRFEAIIGGNNK